MIIHSTTDKAPISIYPQRGSGGYTRGIRLQKNPYPRELERAPRHRGGKLDTSSGSSKLHYITNLMANPRDFGHHKHICSWLGKSNWTKVFQNCLIPHGNPAAPPPGENTDSCIMNRLLMFSYEQFII